MAATAFQTGETFAREMDASDPLAHFRQRFHIPKASDGTESVYLCGHSLGLQPKTVRDYVEQELKDWELLGVEGHFRGKNPWMPYHKLLSEQTAELVGALPSEVVVMNSLTVNLHLMMVSFYLPTPQRHKILIEEGAFPSDQYAVKSQIRFHGYEPASSLIEFRPHPGERFLREDEIMEVIRREAGSIALIMLGGVNYSSGQLFNMKEIAKAGRARGCRVGFDLAHAAGNVPLKLHDWDADFAVWCSYKYLNGGPGCIAGCFVHERHARDWNLPRFAGWWGHDQDTRFLMGPEFKPMPGAEGWQLSNPSILSLAALRASMEIFHEAGIERLREKSLALTGYMEFLLDQQHSHKFSIITPRSPERRGAQLSLRIHHGGRAICDRLLEKGVLVDWREPDILRVAPIPLYNSFQDVHEFVARFASALAESPDH